MKQLFKIISDSDFFYDGGVFTCTFYCLTGKGAFPDDQWTDFAQTVLSWWADEVAYAAIQDETIFRFLFEDGPFWIDAIKKGDQVHLYCKSGRGCANRFDGICIMETTVSFIEIVQELMRATRHLASMLYLAGHIQDSLATNEIASKIAKLDQRLRS